MCITILSILIFLCLDHSKNWPLFPSRERESMEACTFCTATEQRTVGLSSPTMFCNFCVPLIILAQGLFSHISGWVLFVTRISNDFDPPPTVCGLVIQFIHFSKSMNQWSNTWNKFVKQWVLQCINRTINEAQLTFRSHKMLKNCSIYFYSWEKNLWPKMKYKNHCVATK